MSLTRFRRPIILLVFFPAALMAAGIVAATGASSPELAATLNIDPPVAEVPVGNSVTVDVVVNGVANLYGAAIEITFDPTIVQVVGASVTPGPCPQPDFVVLNTADNMAGTINYDVTSLAPAPPCNGTGVIATITFDKIAPGTSPIVFDTWLLADTNGLEIPTTAADGEIRDPVGPGALLWLDPPNPTIPSGGSGLVDLRLDDVSNVFGAQVDLSYDPAVLSVVGSAVTPGVCPAPGFVATNTASGGAISYAVTQLSPTPPCNGGLVAAIEFMCEPGLIVDTPTDVIIASSLVPDPNGLPIPHSTQDATVLCRAGAFDVEGSVSLQAWPHGSEGVEVVLFNDTDGVVADQVVVGPDGTFSLSGETDKLHTLTASYPRYLDIEMTGITSSAPGDLINVGEGMLPAGDLNDDGVINILDISVVAGNFMKASPEPW